MVKYSTLSSLSLLGAASQAMFLPKASLGVSLQTRDTYGNTTVAQPTPADQVTAQTFTLTKDNTLNSTSTFSAEDTPSAPLTLSFTNNFAGGNPVNAYLVGLDPNGQVAFLKADGTLYNPPNPAAGGPPTQVDSGTIAIPLGSTGTTTSVKLSQYVSSARIYFASGNLYFGVNNGANGPNLVQPTAANPSDPSAGLNWGFAEFTWNTQQLFANLSYVDFVGMVIGMLLKQQSGATQEAKGITTNAVTNICKSLQQQAANDGQAWDQLCVTDSSGNPLRVVSPNVLVSTSSNGPFANYWTNYVNSVYNSFASSPLTINTQGAAGDVKGTYNAASGNLEFANGGSFGKPSARDIFGCASGPFANSGDTAHLAIVARLCAAFNRGTLAVSGGNVQPDGVGNAAQFYRTAPANYYSSAVHANEIDGKGYAFAYDDVEADGGANVSGSVNAGDPSSLTITVGGPSA